MDLPLQLNASAGHKANLTCSVSGIPRPVITWFKDGSRVPPSSVREFKGYSVLAFDPVHPKNQGKYWCEANNTEGFNRSSPVNLTGTSKLQSNFSKLTCVSLLLFVDYDHSFYVDLKDSCSFCCCFCRCYCCYWRYCLYYNYLNKVILRLLLCRTVLQLLSRHKNLMIKITRQSMRG